MELPEEAQAAAGDGSRPAAMKKSAWTKEEDAVLKEQVRLHGPQNWAAISKALPGRNPKSCRLRWHSVLGKVNQQQQRAAAPIHHRLPDGALAVFPLAPGDLKPFGRDMIVPPVLQQPLPGVDLSGQCLNLFPLVPGDLITGNNAGEAAAMDVDYSTDESHVELRLWPSSTNHDGGVQGDGGSGN